jgi:hypothetical protein
MSQDILSYNQSQSNENRAICERLMTIINTNMPDFESKIWHGSPVWFDDGNPVVGYSVLKDCVRILFWSGQGFDEPGLQPEVSFKAAEARYTAVDQIDESSLKSWLAKAQTIQWDYKNIVKHMGKLERLK